MDRHEIPQALRHFFAFDLEMAVVHPDIRHQRLMKRAARLRDFVFMVRKDEIDAAAVDIENLAEMAPRHRRAFDVPARTAGRGDPAWRRPRRFAGF